MSDLHHSPQPPTEQSSGHGGDRLSLIARARRNAVDTAAQRAHDALVTGGESMRPTSSPGLLAFCVLVLLVASTAVGLLVWATIAPKNVLG